MAAGESKLNFNRGERSRNIFKKKLLKKINYIDICMPIYLMRE